jgi:hypothetical protein
MVGMQAITTSSHGNTKISFLLLGQRLENTIHLRFGRGKSYSIYLEIETSAQLGVFK